MENNTESSPTNQDKIFKKPDKVLHCPRCNSLYLEDDDSLLRGMMIKGSEYERVLRYLDEDGDGKISTCELRNKIGMLGGEVGLIEAEMVIATVDSDGDGFLCLEDWVKMMEGVEDARKETKGEGGRKL
ncbi:calcium-binding protein CML37-like [Vigna umbellata]|uniref:calcium-binding protein CML37-like n=1 Tax=Vigna umbellata TaxID=87088 RepID=UPI001F5ED6B9|nr:calcium-binding protein CML37-like [Vigna umbellata]